MKIAFVVLTCNSSIDQLRGAMDTWIKDIPDKHSIVLTGSQDMPDQVDDIKIYKPFDRAESYDMLVEKMLITYEHMLHQDWDYIFKCDDDTYVNIHKLIGFINSLQTTSVYVGHGQYVKDNTWFMCTKEKPVIDPNMHVTSYFAQGGAGYIMSRDVVKHVVSDKDYILNIVNSKPKPLVLFGEDVAVGISAARHDVQLMSRPDLFDSGFKDWIRGTATKKSAKESINEIASGTITTHYVSADTMRHIYSL